MKQTINARGTKPGIYEADKGLKANVFNMSSCEFFFKKAHSGNAIRQDTSQIIGEFIAAGLSYLCDLRCVLKCELTAVHLPAIFPGLAIMAI